MSQSYAFECYAVENPPSQKDYESKKILLLSYLDAGKCKKVSESRSARSGEEERDEVFRLEEDRSRCPPAFPR